MKSYPKQFILCGHQLIICISAFKICKEIVGPVGGCQVVSVLALFSDNLSSDPAEIYIFNCVKIAWKERKRGWGKGPLKNYKDTSVEEKTWYWMIYRACLSAVTLTREHLTKREGSTVWMKSSLTRLDLTKEENMPLFVFTETTESKQVKLEISRTVILPPPVSILCFNWQVFLCISCCC